MTDTIRTWRHANERYNLIGSKCKTCGEVFFPSRVVCPTCRRKGIIEPFNFSGKGKIHTFSIIRTPTSEFKKIAPYAVALVELEEGTNISAQIVDADIDKLEIGDPVELVFRKIREDGDDGVITYGFKFKLAK
ncbi:MAG: Zn-ribbon domain-containing OB-fold protein [Methanobrevibacter sp.]|jgi:uncharacterized OB-fold protein|nr:Zn-ribbon domain-containing OB-fold protein [Methanobrevibacter sp.]